MGAFAIKSLWTLALREYAAGYFASSRRAAVKCPEIPLQQQQGMAGVMGLEPMALSCDSCEGRGVLAVVSTIYSKGGKASDPLSSVLQCPDCAGAGIDWRKYYAARGNHLKAAVH